LATFTPVSGVSQNVAKKQRRMFAKKKKWKRELEQGFVPVGYFV